ncbi:MAG: diguanylate cyclase/phosphodiesterase (GGDEF & EAL domains) with PAS/PAC sensor(s), partial [uncultured Acidimicrobiales bacterium]
TLRALHAPGRRGGAGRRLHVPPPPGELTARCPRSVPRHTRGARPPRHERRADPCGRCFCLPGQRPQPGRRADGRCEVRAPVTARSADRAAEPPGAPRPVGARGGARQAVPHQRGDPLRRPRRVQDRQRHPRSPRRRRAPRRGRRPPLEPPARRRHPRPARRRRVRLLLPGPGQSIRRRAPHHADQRRVRAPVPPHRQRDHHLGERGSRLRGAGGADLRRAADQGRPRHVPGQADRGRLRGRRPAGCHRGQGL